MNNFEPYKSNYDVCKLLKNLNGAADVDVYVFAIVKNTLSGIEKNRLNDGYFFKILSMIEEEKLTELFEESSGFIIYGGTGLKYSYGFYSKSGAKYFLKNVLEPQLLAWKMIGE